MKKLLALALIIVSVLAIAAPALAYDPDGYDDYLGPGTSSVYNLREGQVNQRVQNLQIMLIYAGYNPGSTDGNFGPRTKAAVCEFQKAYTLTPDGIVGEDTKATLWMALSCQAPPDARSATRVLGLIVYLMNGKLF